MINYHEMVQVNVETKGFKSIYTSIDSSIIIQHYFYFISQNIITSFKNNLFRIRKNIYIKNPLQQYKNNLAVL
jgi:hypothetical protein